jgi:hypothetical protein
VLFVLAAPVFLLPLPNVAPPPPTLGLSPWNDLGDGVPLLEAGLDLDGDTPRKAVAAALEGRPEDDVIDNIGTGTERDDAVSPTSPTRLRDKKGTDGGGGGGMLGKCSSLCVSSTTSFQPPKCLISMSNLRLTVIVSMASCRTCFIPGSCVCRTIKRKRNKEKET